MIIKYKIRRSIAYARRNPKKITWKCAHGKVQTMTRLFKRFFCYVIIAIVYVQFRIEISPAREQSKVQSRKEDSLCGKPGTILFQDLQLYIAMSNAPLTKPTRNVVTFPLGKTFSSSTARVMTRWI